MVVRYLQMSEQYTAGKRKHATLMTPQALLIIRRLDNGRNWSVVIALYNTGLSTVYDVKKQMDLYSHFWHQVKV